MAPARSIVLAAVLGAAAVIGLATAATAAPPRLFDSPSIVIREGFLPSDAATADLNGDGRLDLIVLNSWTSTVQVALGGGDGTFDEGGSFTAGRNAMTLSTGDVNGDGRLDLLLSHQSVDGVDLLLGNGNGTFQPPATFSCNSGTNCAVLADVDGDGKLDMVAGCMASKISIFRGHGNGTFEPRLDTSNPQAPAAIAVTDLDGDGAGDVIVANAGASTLSVWRGTTAGGIGARTDYATPGPVSRIALANVVGSTAPDVIVSSPSANAVCFFAATGGIALGARTDLGGFDDPESVLATDLDGDGHADLAVADGPWSTGATVVRLGDGAGNFAAAATFPVGVWPRGIAVGDFDGDGHPDLATAEWNSGSASVLLGNGDGTFGLTRAYSTGAAPHGLASGDVDGDGIPDLVVANGGDNTVSVFHGNGDGTLGARSDLAVASYPWSLAIADLNGDGKPDLAVADSLEDAVSILLGHGDGTFDVHVETPAGDGPRALAVADVDLDGIPDLLVGASGARRVTVLKGAGDGTFTTIGSINPGLGAGPHSVAVGLFNGDALPDLAIACSFGTFAVVYGTGSGAFGTPQYFPSYLGAEKLTATDVDGDGKCDLLVSGGGASFVRGLGDGSFATPVVLLPSAGTGMGNAVADLDGDGTLDCVATTAGYLFTARGLGGGTFEAGVNYGTEGGASDVAVLLRTGGPDLVVSDPFANRVVIVANRGSSNTGVPVSRGTSALRLALTPRPARDAMRVAFTLPRAGDVRLAAYDLAGRRVATLAQGAQVAGPHEVPWRVGAVRAGLYFIVLEAGGERAVARAIVTH